MPAYQRQYPQSSDDAMQSDTCVSNGPTMGSGKSVRRRAIGHAIFTFAAVGVWLGAAAGGQTPVANHLVDGSSSVAAFVNTPCDGVDLEATWRYRPSRRTDGHVQFPIGSLSLAVPASLPV